MLRRTKILSLGVILGLLVVGAGCQNTGPTLGTPNTATSTFSTAEVLKKEQFACANIDDVTFTYPLFKGFEIKPSGIMMAKKDVCVLQFGETYRLTLTKEYYHGTPGKMSPPEGYNLKNSQNVSYRVYEDPKNVVGFWTGDAVVKVELSGEDNANFSKEEFWKEVVDSFEIKK